MSRSPFTTALRPRWFTLAASQFVWLDPVGFSTGVLVANYRRRPACKGHVSKGVRNVRDQRRIERDERRCIPCGVTEDRVLGNLPCRVREIADVDDERFVRVYLVSAVGN